MYHHYLQKPPTPRPSHESIVSNKNSLYFLQIFQILCELNILLAMEKTFEQKLEAKPIFPGPLVDTGGCALTCSIWFLRHHQNLTVGSRAIFENPLKTSIDLTKSSIPCCVQIAPRCTIRIVLLVWTSHVLCIHYYLQKPPTSRPSNESIVSNKNS